MERIARQGGASDVTFFGDHNDQSYNPAGGVDLIMVATKGA
jgi:hypothetical protein